MTNFQQNLGAVKVGRPKKGETKTPINEHRIRLQAVLSESLKRLAESQDKPVSQIIREALAFYVDISNI